MLPNSRRRPLGVLSLAVFLALVVASVAVSLLIRSVIVDQERRLLRERTAEAGLVVTTLYSGSRVTLPLLAATTRPTATSPDAFLRAADAVRGPGSIGAVRVADGRVETIAIAGETASPGAAVSGALADVAVRATTTGDASGVVDVAGGRTLVIAVATGEGVVLYQAIPVLGVIDLGEIPNSPFSELDGVVYASAEEDPASVVLATTEKLPLTGTVERQRVPFGDETWLIVARPNGPLVGSFAAKAPWLVLALAVVTVLLLTVLIETLSRRRRYAMELVEERTHALREALAEQARLEQGERHAREAAEAANRSKSEFLSRMSHELRTPLNAVLGFGQLLELDELEDAQRESVEQIVKGGRHLLSLINEVLDISRIETGTLALSPESVLVGDVVNDTLTLMRPLADNVGVRIVNDVAADAHVLADRQRFKQILLNLVANAVKYNRSGGSVTVSSAVVGDDRLSVTVADTGIGIPGEYLDRLFVPFERLGAERTDVEGAGVGLALSLGLAEAMDGDIIVDSLEGEGSRFSVTLPLAEDPVARYHRLNGDEGDSSDADRGYVDGDDAATPMPERVVLYVEDNVSNVRLVERVLERRADVSVIPAMQGSLALALAREHRPTVILLDLHLPDMGGTDVLRQLRGDPVTADTPIVMLSADATEGQIERLLAEGATAYLTKPLDVQEFLSVLDEVLAGAAPVTS